jgi:hypothetical protein
MLSSLISKLFAQAQGRHDVSRPRSPIKIRKDYLLNFESIIKAMMSGQRPIAARSKTFHLRE